MKKLFISIFILSLLGTWSCNDDDFLSKTPNNILNDEQVWKNRDLVVLVLADLYNRYPDYQSIENWGEFANFDEAFATRDNGRHQNNDYGLGSWGYWDYSYIRALNAFIERCNRADQLAEEDKQAFLAEARFLRASVYFEEVKRMGGVPLILEPLTYDYSGDPTYLQHARAKEHEVYDFVLSELDEIKASLFEPAAEGKGRIYSRATQGLALAMKARVALYAASIAKYGAATPSEFTAGGEAGIASGMAQAYYQKSFDAAQELIGKGWYSLYQKNTNLRENFTNLFLDKSNNTEVIFAKDFKLKDKPHGFTTNNQPIDQTEEPGDSGFLNSTLNLVQSFEKLDNTFASLDIGTPGNYKYYTNITDLYEDRDARLWGTVMLPGTQFKGRTVDIWAGYILADNTVVSSGDLGGKGRLPGKNVDEQVVGKNGPIDQLEKAAQTGYYVRKYMDPTIGSGQRGVGSAVWWIRYRYAEVLLNAAEAAFELGQPGVAADYMNQVRRRAGFTIDLTATDITFDRIVHERKVELAFEGHQLWDMKRWRLAHKVWNGQNPGLTMNPGKADQPSTKPYGLWPYKVYNPGNPNDGKWVFKVIVPGRATGVDNFRLQNYYSQISSDILSRNPKLVQNP